MKWPSPSGRGHRRRRRPSARLPVTGTVVTLTWSAADAASIVVVARLSPAGPVLATLPSAGTGIAIPGVPPGSYYVSVVAVRDGVVGAESNVVRVDVR